MPTLLSLFGIIPNKIGSREAFARELSLQLAQQGWRSILCFESVPPEPVYSYLALPNVSFDVLQSPERMQWDTLKKFIAILRRHRPDILHLYYVGFLGLYPWLAWLCGVKRVYFMDDASRPAFHVPRRAPLWKRTLARLIIWPLSSVICASAYCHRCMTALDVLPADRLQVIYNAVDTRRALDNPRSATEFRRKYGIPADRSVVTQVSSIIEEKGIVDLLEAARLVIRQHPDVQFVLVGDGASRDEYVRLAAKMGVEDHVTWTGLIQDPFAEGVYAAADLVCQVSRWEEGFGFVIAEAMACAKPVVATAVGAIPELVDDGETGFLVPRGDALQIAYRILQLLADGELKARLGRAGQQVAAAKFDVKRNVAQLLHLYGLNSHVHETGS